MLHCFGSPPRQKPAANASSVALGRALIREPKVLLLDEPFANLDEPLRAQMRAELPTLRQRFATTIIFVTHDQEGSPRAGRSHCGDSQRRNPTSRFAPRNLRTPANRFVASFIGAPTMNLFHGSIAQRESHLLF